MPDLIIVGAGIGGLTAALFAARDGLDVFVLERMAPGGQLLNVETIEDLPGYSQGIAGYDLGPILHEQAEAAGARFALAEVAGLRFERGEWHVDAGRESATARFIIVATGSAPRPVEIAGVESLLGRGVSHCASCDAPLYRERNVAVIGGGDSAFQEALTVSGHASDVVVIARTVRAQRVYRDRCAAHPRVRVLDGATAVAVRGANSVEGVEVVGAPEFASIEVSGVFLSIGSDPATAWLPAEVGRDRAGHVAVDLSMRSTVPTIYAIGAARAHYSGQAVSAAGDGATAAMAIARSLRSAKGQTSASAS
ncbi:MAG: FAD-binding protein [Chloroflexi bacterium]|nr:FAD-binding protein [Chloroflexota bacterium]